MDETHTTSPHDTAERDGSPQPAPPTLHPYPRPAHASPAWRDTAGPLVPPHPQSIPTPHSPHAHSPQPPQSSPPPHSSHDQGPPYTPSSPPVFDCMCPTCMYYKWAMVQHHSSLSPMAHTFVPYDHQGVAHTDSHSPSPTHRRSHAPRVPLVADTVVDAEFEAAVGSLADMACTAAGRTLLQQVLRARGGAAIHTLLDELIPHIERVALDPHGCHVLRSLIEVLNDESIVLMINSLSETLILNMCTVSQYTRRVLQALFERKQCYDLQGVVDILSRSVVYLAATQQGCISMMRIFEHVNGEQRHQLALPMLPMMCSLASDPFGNYVVQCVLQNSSPAVGARYVTATMVGHFEELACNKFASNVLETIARTPNMGLVRRLIIDELLAPPTFARVVHDAYGNFVVQALIDTCEALQELRRLSDLRHVMARSPYATKIENKLRSRRATLDAMRSGPPSVPRHGASVVPAVV